MIVGIIGLGAMGKLYATRLAESGVEVIATDVPEKLDEVRAELEPLGIKILRDGHLVSRQADYTIYSVEASNIDRVVSEYGPSTKLGAIVGGQTSCKAPEIAAFEKHLPKDVEIVTVHSMHGPGVDPKGQPLAIIQHRASDDSRLKVEKALSCLGGSVIHISAIEHDTITADVQAVTHMAFLSMGTAWKSNQQYPWANPRLNGGLENAKINIAMRIYSNTWHVYAGLAITNPMAHIQSLQYANSVTDLLKLMVAGRGEELRERLYAARDYVFHKVIEDPRHSLLLPDELLGQFSLSKDTVNGKRQPNSHLSILGIVDCWHRSKIIPYDHMICSTPLFRILLGVTEFLFMTPGLLDMCIRDSLSTVEYRGDDVEFVVAARTWSLAVRNGDFEAYRSLFEDTRDYFAPMLPEAMKIGNEMIKAINLHTEERRRELSNDIHAP